MKMKLKSWHLYVLATLCFLFAFTSLNMKYTLVLSNKETLEVSRSYYYQFKEEIGF